MFHSRPLKTRLTRYAKELRLICQRSKLSLTGLIELDSSVYTKKLASNWNRNFQGQKELTPEIKKKEKNLEKEGGKCQLFHPLPLYPWRAFWHSEKCFLILTGLPAYFGLRLVSFRGNTISEEKVHNRKKLVRYYGPKFWKLVRY